ncbi:MAG TPA: VOC family protein [Acidimicrobiales bacterium]|jgi:predicted enzyme related to lactoylglutathione lyase|nr:VOC family protein [Acidimicrobiales bacterium]
MEVVNSRTIIHPANLDRSLEFYGSQLGLAVARQFGSGPFRGVVFFLGGGFIEVSGHSDATPPTPAGAPPIALWLQVRDAEATVVELADRGVPIVRSPQLEPWGLIEAWIEDPDGLRIHLVEIPEDHPIRRDVRDLPPD